MNFAVTIGNASAYTMERWLSDNPLVAPQGVTLIDATGFYQGHRENSVLVLVWDVTVEAVDRMLDAYGRDHKQEECFGVTEMPDSALTFNPHWIVPVKQEV